MDGQAAERRHRERDVGQPRQPGFARELLGLLEATLGPRPNTQYWIQNRAT